MSYLDDFASLLSRGSGDDTPLAARTTLETVRAQLEDAPRPYLEYPEGTFHTTGTRNGCGYASVTLVVDEDGGTCTLDIATHIHVAPENARAVRRMMHMINNTLVETGLCLADDNTVHFTPDGPLNVRAGHDVDQTVGRGLSTVRQYADKFTAISAGVKPWDLI